METDRPLAAALASLQAKMAEQSAAFESELDSAPLERPCATHPEIRAVFDRERSEEVGRVVYACARCDEAAAQRERFRRQSEIGIPSDVRNARFSNFDRTGKGISGSSRTPAEFAEAAAKFARGEMRNLMLAGTPGIGKGHLAAAILNRLIDEGAKGLLWISAGKLFADYHAAYEDNSNAAYIAYLASRRILVLDECAFRDLPRDGEQILFELLDARQKRGNQTLILSNAVKQALYEWLGERVIDRLRSGGGDFLWGQWESKRGTDRDGANNLSI